MKKLLFTAIAVLGFGAFSFAQSFGVTAGFTSISEKLDAYGMSVTVSESGFYVGALAEVEVSDSFLVQPEVLYLSTSNADMLSVPILAKYLVTEELAVLAGPQLNYILSDVADDFSALGVGIGAGASYDITEEFFIEAKYSFEFTDRYTGDLDYSDKINSFTVGVGYKF